MSGDGRVNLSHGADGGGDGDGLSDDGRLERAVGDGLRAVSNSADLSSVDGRGGHLLGVVGVSTGNESVGNASSGGKGKESLHSGGWLGFVWLVFGVFWY